MPFKKVNPTEEIKIKYEESPEYAKAYEEANRQYENVKARIQKAGGKPTCFKPNEDTFPLCVGLKNAKGALVTACEVCCLYEDLKEGEY